MFDVFAENGFAFLAQEYADLFKRSQATPFQHPLWLDLLYAKIAPVLGAAALIVTVRFRSDGRLAMVLPLVRQRHGILRVIEFADLKVSDYVAPVCERETFGLILRDESACARIRAALKPYDLLRMQKLRDGGPEVERLFGAADRVPMAVSAHGAALSAPYEAWRAGAINSSYCKELDKKRRQLNRRGTLRFETSTDPAVIRRTFESMREYRKPRFQDRDAPDLLQQAVYFDFYLDLAMRGVAEGLTRTYTLFMGERPIAGVFGLRQRNEFLVILGGFDLAGYKNQSLGALMFEEVVRDCIARGDTFLDLTIGDESYKSLFGAHPTPLWMQSQAGSPLGALAKHVVEQMPWTMKMARRLINRRTAGALRERAMSANANPA